MINNQNTACCFLDRLQLAMNPAHSLDFFLISCNNLGDNSKYDLLGGSKVKYFAVFSFTTIPPTFSDTQNCALLYTINIFSLLNSDAGGIERCRRDTHFLILLIVIENVQQIDNWIVQTVLSQYLPVSQLLASAFTWHGAGYCRSFT